MKWVDFIQNRAEWKRGLRRNEMNLFGRIERNLWCLKLDHQASKVGNCSQAPKVPKFTSYDFCLHHLMIIELSEIWSSFRICTVLVYIVIIYVCFYWVTLVFLCHVINKPQVRLHYSITGGCNEQLSSLSVHLGVIIGEKWNNKKCPKNVPEVD